MKQKGIAPLALALIAIILSSTAATVVPAAIDSQTGNNIQSDDVLYPVERWGENINSIIASDKTKWKVERAMERIEEYKDGLKKGFDKNSLKEESDELIEEVESDLNAYRGQDLNFIREKLMHHIIVLQEVKALAPSQAQNGLQNAIDSSSEVIERIEEKISEDERKPPQTVECADASTCEGLVHVMCVGEWQCIQSRCVWRCGTQEGT